MKRSFWSPGRYFVLKIVALSGVLVVVWVAGWWVVFRVCGVPWSKSLVEVVTQVVLSLGTVMGLFGLLQWQWSRYQQLQQDLAASEERLRLALAGNQDAVWDLDFVTGKVVVSDRWFEMLGYAPREIPVTIESWQGLLHPDDLAGQREAMQRLLEGGDVEFDAEYRMRSKSGDWVWVEDRGRVTRKGADGRVERITGTKTDITAKKTLELQLAESEEALHLSERNYRALFQQNPFPTWLYEVSTLRFLEVNEAAVNHYGFTRAEFLGMTLRDIREPDQIPLLEKHLAEEAGVVSRFMRAKHRCKDGSVRDVDVFSNRVALEGGEVRLVVAVDVTERLRAEEQLGLVSAALEAAANAVVITDVKGNIAWVNRAFQTLTGYSRDEVQGRNVRVLRSGAHAEAFYRDLWRTVLAGKVWHGELVNRRKDGTTYSEEMTVTPVANGAGGVRHFVAIKQDITARKAMEAQLLRTQRLESIGLLASGIAHDLNNVLTPVIMGAELLRLKTTDPEQQQTLDTMERSARRGSEVVRQVLTFARGGGGGRRPLFPGPLVKEIARVARETFPRDVTLSVVCPEATAPVTGDATQLHQVILNLCLNARDAMPAGGSLMLQVDEVELDAAGAARLAGARVGRFVRLTVADTGTGMSQETLDRIFDPFFTTKELGAGTGLGLSTVLGLVRAHDGFLTVDSVPAKGSTFAVYLPQVEAVVEPEHVARVTPARGGGERVLVVDDEAGLRQVAANVLRNGGRQVELAADGAEALQLLVERGADVKVLVTDIMMPVMDGCALVRAVRRLRPELPVVAMSGLAEDQASAEKIQLLKQLGVREVLRKPFTADLLLCAVNEALCAAKPGAPTETP